MSFVKSQASVPAELSDALQAALIEVGENAYFVFVEPVTLEQFAALAGEAVGPWMTASVSFAGASSGSIEIVLPEELARWLVTSLLGMPGADLTSPELSDGVGEFANMVCGAWLSKSSGKTALFELAPPSVCRKDVSWLPVDGMAADGSDGYRMVTLNDMPMAVRIQ